MFSTTWNSVQSIFSWSPVDAIRSGWSGVIAFFATLDLGHVGTNILGTLSSGIQSAAMLPFNAVKTAFAVLQNLGGSLFNLTGNGRTIMTTMMGGILEAGGALIQSVSAVFGQAWDGVASAVQGFMDVGHGLVDGLGSVLGSAWDGVQSIFDWSPMERISAAWSGIPGMVSGVMDQAEGIITSAFSAIRMGLGFDPLAILSSVWQPVAGFFGTVVKKVHSSFISLTSIGDGVLDPLTNAWLSVQSIFSWSPMDVIRSGWTGVTAFFATIDLSHVGTKILGTLASGIQSAAMLPFNAVKTAFGFIRNLLPFSDAKEGPLSNLTNNGRAVMTTVTGGILEAGGALIQSVSAVFGQARDSMASVVGGFLDLSTGLAHGVGSTLGKAWEGIHTIFDWSPVERISAGWSGIPSAIGGVMDQAKATVGALFSAIQTNLAFDPLATLSSAWQPVAGFFGTVADGVRAAFTGLGDGLASVMTDPVVAIKKTVVSIQSSVAEIWNGPLAGLAEKGRSIFSTMADGILETGSQLVQDIGGVLEWPSMTAIVNPSENQESPSMGEVTESQPPLMQSIQKKLGAAWDWAFGDHEETPAITKPEQALSPLATPSELNTSPPAKADEPAQPILPFTLGSMGQQDQNRDAVFPRSMEPPIPLSLGQTIPPIPNPDQTATPQNRQESQISPLLGKAMGPIDSAAAPIQVGQTVENLIAFPQPEPQQRPVMPTMGEVIAFPQTKRQEKTPTTTPVSSLTQPARATESPPFRIDAIHSKPQPPTVAQSTQAPSITINVTVQAAPGMDTRQLAEEVARQIEIHQRRAEARQRVANFD